MPRLLDDAVDDTESWDGEEGVAYVLNQKHPSALDSDSEPDIVGSEEQVVASATPLRRSRPFHIDERPSATPPKVDAAIPPGSPKKAIPPKDVVASTPGSCIIGYPMADLSKNTYGYDGPSRQAWRSTVPYNSRLLQYTADIVIDEGAKDADPAFARFPSHEIFGFAAAWAIPTLLVFDLKGHTATAKLSEAKKKKLEAAKEKKLLAKEEKLRKKPAGAVLKKPAAATDTSKGRKINPRTGKAWVEESDFEIPTPELFEGTLDDVKVRVVRRKSENFVSLQVGRSQVANMSDEDLPTAVAIMNEMADKVCKKELLPCQSVLKDWRKQREAGEDV